MKIVAMMLLFPLMGCGEAEVRTVEQSKASDKEVKVSDGPLVLRVRADKYQVRPSEPIVFTAELSNDGPDDAVIYMPGINGWVMFIEADRGAKNSLLSDAFGPPFGLGRSTSPRSEDNYILLQPGDVYSRRYSFSQQSPCDVAVRFFYENKIGGKHGIWLGKSRTIETVVRVR
ncbi:MAG: hypothetical protein ABFC77_14435 [Thermoguttaceae bacterium]